MDPPFPPKIFVFEAGAMGSTREGAAKSIMNTANMSEPGRAFTRNQNKPLMHLFSRSRVIERRLASAKHDANPAGDKGDRKSK